jgi:GrpB-like predicted nucleotidyltransferase (UPF0157 family)
MHYDPRWRQEFAQTRSSVLFSGEGWITDVQHVGGTALPGLVSRPVIDCAVSVCCLADLDEASERIEGLNFRQHTPPRWLGQGRFFAKPRHGETTHHIFLVEETSGVWKSLLSFRDKLLSDRDLALAFEAAKVTAWRDGEGNTIAYEKAKESFFC